MSRAHQVVDRYVRLGGSLALLEALSDQFEAMSMAARGGRGSDTLEIEYPVSNGKPLVPRMVDKKALTDKG